MSLIEKKYQLFVSSTYKDLINAREEVIKVILNTYHIPIGMEMFSADNDEQWEIIKDTIDSSDYYILIIGHRYGSETKEGIGYTEKEFDYAKETGVPIYAYIRKRDVSTTPNERDREHEKSVKLDAFITKVEGNSTVEYWEQPADLGQKVSIAMPKAFRRHPRVGWVRSDLAASPETLQELTILSKENRELKAELELLNQANQKSPALQVLFNNEPTITLKLPKDFRTDKLLTEARYAYPPGLPIEAEPFYTERTIKEFNDWLSAHPKEVEEYNSNVFAWERAKAGIEETILGVFNRGSLKANDINVTITFPKEIMVFSSESRHNIPNWPYPKGAPEDPYKIAMKAHKRKQRGEDVPYLKRSEVARVHISPHSSVKVVDQVVSLYFKSVLHTQKGYTDKEFAIYLMPFSPGEFTAEIEIICEEYAEPQINAVPIAVFWEK